MPETLADELLKMKAKELRRATGDDRYRTALERTRATVPFKVAFVDAAQRPFKMLVMEPIVVAFSLYMTLVSTAVQKLAPPLPHPDRGVASSLLSTTFLRKPKLIHVATLATGLCRPLRQPSRLPLRLRHLRPQRRPSRAHLHSHRPWHRHRRCSDPLHLQVVPQGHRSRCRAAWRGSRPAARGEIEGRDDWDLVDAHLALLAVSGIHLFSFTEHRADLESPIACSAWTCDRDLTIWPALVSQIFFGMSILCCFISSYQYIIGEFSPPSAPSEEEQPLTPNFGSAQTPTSPPPPQHSPTSPSSATS